MEHCGGGGKGSRLMMAHGLLGLPPVELMPFEFREDTERDLPISHLKEGTFLGSNITRPVHWCRSRSSLPNEVWVFLRRIIWGLISPDLFTSVGAVATYPMKSGFCRQKLLVHEGILHVVELGEIRKLAETKTGA